MIADREALERTPSHVVALDCISAGIDAADPERAVRDRLSLEDGTMGIDDVTYDLDRFEEILVVGAGKGVTGLVHGLEAVLGERLSGGIVVSPTAASAEQVEILEGGHPLPTEAGVRAARRVHSLVELADDRTLLLAALTGGGSALLSVPAEGLTVDDLRATSDALLDAGVEIAAINAVRKHLSAVKGGQLAQAAGEAPVSTLLVSDVVGDDPAVIASGPFAPDASTFAEALAAIEGVTVPEAVRTHLERGAAGELAETPHPGDAAFDRVQTHLLAGAETALVGAAEAAERAGYNAHLLDQAVTGEARTAAADHLDAARQVLAGEAPVAPPAVLLTGGEVTVTVRGSGTGGPNQEFCLASALECPAGVVVAAVDTDGLDGSTDAAGAIVDDSTVDAPGAAREALADNDAFGYLGDRGALVRTGPTGTNVNDLRVVAVW